MKKLYFLKNKIFLKSLFVGIFLFYVIFIAAPVNFQTHTIVAITKNMTLTEVAKLLDDRGIIKNQFIYKVLVTLVPGDTGVLLGDYFFPTKDNLFTVAYRTARGKFGIDSIRVTLLEGQNNKELADVLDASLPEFDKEFFLNESKTLEGYLFPDTYYLLPTQTTKDIIVLLNTTFEQKTKLLKEKVIRKGMKWEDVVIMASLLEEEARTFETKKQIAGILWKRLKIGMPLQVDAVFSYIFGKNGLDITLNDLKIDSPYNTYKYAGLPIGPITNPGLDSLEAALYDEETPYLYYLSSADGVTHYAEDFEQHKTNKSKYLD